MNRQLGYGEEEEEEGEEECPTEKESRLTEKGLQKLLFTAYEGVPFACSGVFEKVDNLKLHFRGSDYQVDFNQLDIERIKEVRDSSI